jgi:mitogen-activated protein kinase kinase 7
MDSAERVAPPVPLRPGKFMSLDPVSTKRTTTPTEAEVNQRYEKIKEKSGVLEIGGHTFKNVRLDDLELVSELGSGTCGVVTKRKLRSRTLAVKEMRRTDNLEESKRIFMDLEVVQRCNGCRYIVECYGYLITMDHLYICMEMMATCLDKLLCVRKSFPEEIIGKITLSVVHALEYLKENLKLMHRDVKPSNILIDWVGHIKLCDFGISGQLIDSKASTMSTGCTAYLAPERIVRSPYDVRSDVWSLGITLYQLATGEFPYDLSAGPFQIMILIREEPSPYLEPNEKFSREFSEFVNACLLKDYQSRPKYKQLLETNFLKRAENEDVDVAMWFTNPDEYNGIVSNDDDGEMD